MQADSLPAEPQGKPKNTEFKEKSKCKENERKFNKGNNHRTQLGFYQVVKKKKKTCKNDKVGPLLEKGLSSWGFPGGSDGKASACSAGDLGLIPGLGRSPGEGIAYKLQDSWAFLVAQLVKNQPAMQETWV